MIASGPWGEVSSPVLVGEDTSLIDQKEDTMLPNALVNYKATAHLLLLMNNVPHPAGSRCDLTQQLKENMNIQRRVVMKSKR